MTEEKISESAMDSLYQISQKDLKVFDNKLHNYIKSLKHINISQYLKLQFYLKTLLTILANNIEDMLNLSLTDEEARTYTYQEMESIFVFMINCAINRKK